MLDLDTQSLMLYPESPVLSWLLIYLAASFILMLARDFVHNFVHKLFLALAEIKKSIGEKLDVYAEKLETRAKKLAIEYFLREKEHDIAKSHTKLEHSVESDLSQLPQMQHTAMTLTDQLSSAFEAAKIPPTQKEHYQLEWLKDEVSRYTQDVGITSQEAKTVGKSIKKIHVMVSKELKAFHTTCKKDSKKRIKVLSKQRAPLKGVQNVLTKLEATVSQVHQATFSIEEKLTEYYVYRKDEDKALRAANTSIITRFCIALFFVCIAIGGAALNFFLIERPLSEIVGGGGLILGMEVSQMGAMMIIMLEIATGIFLMETLGLSHLLPNIERWEPEVKKKVAVITGVLLLSLAGVEAGLAVLREVLIANDQATLNLLIGQEDDVSTDMLSGWAPMTIQAVMGFVIPIILAFVALPMEILFHVVRIVVQYGLAMLVYALSYILRLLSKLLCFVMDLLLSMYDLLIFFWLFVYNWIQKIWVFFEQRTGVKA